MVEWEDMEITYLPKHIKSASTSGMILSENFNWRLQNKQTNKQTNKQKNTSCIIKAVIKIHIGLSRKGREPIRSGLVPLEEDTEEGINYMGGDPPWIGGGLSHILAAPALGPDTRKMCSLVCLVGKPMGLTRGLWEG